VALGAAHGRLHERGGTLQLIRRGTGLRCGFREVQREGRTRARLRIGRNHALA